LAKWVKTGIRVTVRDRVRVRVKARVSVKVRISVILPLTLNPAQFPIFPSFPPSRLLERPFFYHSDFVGSDSKKKSKFVILA